MRGKLVLIEGDDYAGKTTFVTFLKSKHPEYVYSKEPGGSAMSERVREILLSDEGRTIDPTMRFHLFWASRAENLAKVIRPALSQGKIVVSDRFDASTFAYQVGGDGRRDLEELFWRVREFHMRDLDPIYVFFNIPMRTAEKRRAKRLGEQNHFDKQGRKYREDVARHYAVFFCDTRIKNRTSFAAEKPEALMLKEAYELFQKLVA